MQAMQAVLDARSPTSTVVSVKEGNPKDAVGSLKFGMSNVSAQVIAEMSVGMLEGALKYGRHNYRIKGVRASVYYDAANRHIMAYWEGEDIDPESGLPHIVKAMTSLAVLREGYIMGNVQDDRPPRLQTGWIGKLNEMVAALIKKYPDPKAPFTHEGNPS